MKSGKGNLMCKLLNGTVTGYAAAFPIDSELKVSSELKLIGKGSIHSYYGRPYYSKKIFHFYVVKKKSKK